MKNPFEDVGKRLITLRGPITRNDFATRFKVSPSSLLRWEAGEASPNLNFMADLSSEFGVSTDWIITGKGDGPAEVPNGRRSAERQSSAASQHIENIDTHNEKPPTIGHFPPALADLNAKLMTLKDELLELTRQHADLRVEREQLRHDLEVRQRAMEGLAQRVAELEDERIILIKERDGLRNGGKQ